jgi:hypothetical protein
MQISAFQQLGLDRNGFDEQLLGHARQLPPRPSRYQKWCACERRLVPNLRVPLAVVELQLSPDAG